MNTIVIDCGASFLKSALINEGKIVRRLESASPRVHRDESIFEIVQIDKLVERVKEVILELARDEKAIKLCISNEMHGFILANEDGTPYTDYISWQKEYGAISVGKNSAYELLSVESLAEEILNSGMPLRAGLPSCNLLYMAQNNYLNGKRLYFYTLGDYIIRCLSKVEPICHPTNAAATGLYDLRTNDWNRKLIRFITKDDIVFPKVGTTTIDFVLDGINVILYPAIGDQQAALLGAGVTEYTDISYNLGTGSQVSKIVDVPECGLNYQIRPYFNGKYLKTLPHIPSGRALNVYIRFFQSVLNSFGVKTNSDEIWKVILDLLHETCQTELECDMSFFENAITENVKGSIECIGEYDFDMLSLTHAIFDAMSKNYLTATKIIEPQFSRFERVVFSGGVARKIEYLRNKILSSFNDSVKVVIARDETLLGLYYYSL